MLSEKLRLQLLKCWKKNV